MCMIKMKEASVRHSVHPSHSLLTIFAVDDYVGSFTVWINDGAQVQTLKGMTGTDKGEFGFQVGS